MQNRAAIDLLPVKTRSELRSTQILTSLPQLVSELIQNSLDANATQVDVGVDPEQWACWVRDDGVGISRDGMALLEKGKEVGRYGTSKAYNVSSLDRLSTFGFRGEALASAVDLSCIEISSRTAESKESWSVILKGGDTLYVGPAVRWRRERPGTVVNIRDAFYNMPVRRSTHHTPARTLELVRKDLESFALMFPRVAFTLENTAKERIEGSGRGRLMTVSKTSSTLATFRQLHGRALAQTVEEIHEQLEDVKFDGFISLEGAHSKAYQYLYVNRHLLNQSELHRTIEAHFASSSFSRRTCDESDELENHQSSRRSPRKNERRPVYVINISMPSKALDMCIEPAKAAVQFEDIDSISAALGRIVHSFLLRHGFHPTAAPSLLPPRRSNDRRPSKRRRIESDGSSSDEDSEQQAEAGPGPSFHREVPLRLNETRPDSTVFAFPDSETLEGDNWTSWRDPTTREQYLIDTRSGNSVRRGHDVEEREQEGEADPRRAKSTIVDRRWLQKTRGRVLQKDPAALPSWMTGVLEDWKNPAFDVSDELVKSLHSSAFDFGTTEAGYTHDMHAPSLKMLSRFFAPGAAPEDTTPPRRFSRADLAKAQVIRQVDRKFIACSMPASGKEKAAPNEVLILVDQHAADERIRVESFLRDLCLGFLQHGTGRSVTRQELEPPKLVLVTRRESAALEAVTTRTAFERWGITLRVPQSSIPETSEAGKDYVQVAVQSVPEVVSVKLLLGNEMRELIKGYLGKLDEEGVESLPPPDLQLDPREAIEDEEDLTWMKALRWCPRGLLDLVNSRACRGAIMFNDPLSLDQCQRLIFQLAQTAFPFQCAHGRPSLVPLAKLGNKTLSLHGARDVNWGGFSS